MVSEMTLSGVDQDESLDGSPYRLARTPSELASIRRHLSSGTREVHVTALDEVVSVNSFFTVAVFIGIALTASSGSSLHIGPSSAPHCSAGLRTFRQLILCEILAFSCFQFSSLVAHGLKLLMVFKNSKRTASTAGATIDQRLLRFGILAAAVGSMAGTTFLMLSLVSYAQLRFGLLECGGAWTLLSAVPLIALVSVGILFFVCAVVYAFLH